MMATVIHMVPNWESFERILTGYDDKGELFFWGVGVGAREGGKCFVFDC